MRSGAKHTKLIRCHTDFQETYAKAILLLKCMQICFPVTMLRYAGNWPKIPSKAFNQLQKAHFAG